MKKLIAAVVALGLGWGVALAQEAPKQEGPKYGKNVGDVAKPTKVKTFDDKEFDTGSVSKRSMFVFVNSACGMCAREVLDLEKNADKMGSVDIYLVAVDVQKDRAAEKYAQFEKKFKLLHDPEYQFGENVDFYQTPATLILDKGGKIVFKAAGYRPEGLKAIAEAAKAQ